MTLSALPRTPTPHGPPHGPPHGSRDGPGRPRNRADLVRGTARWTGELLLTLGVIALAFVAWQLWGTGLATSRAQDVLGDQLTQQWSHAPGPGSAGAPGPGPGPQAPGTQAPGTQVPGPPAAAPPVGDALLRLRIPAIDVDWVVVQGVALRDLAKGPGHYPDSAMPGQVGNLAVAGHRTTHGAPFFRIAELAVGDSVEVEVADRVYTYRVTSAEIVSPGTVSVVAPVPGRPGVRPTRRLLTLTSCNPQYSASQRYVVHAELASTRSR